jgi:hypothetical protein
MSLNAGVRPRRSVVRVIFVASTAAALALGACGTGVVMAESSAPSAKGGQTGELKMNEGQIAANQVAERLQAAIGSDHLSGFSGIEVNPSPKGPGLTVYWHGRIPSQLTELAADAGTPQATGIEGGVGVRFQWAPYTQTELLDLRRAVNDLPDFPKLGISSMGFYPQATGFWIGVNTEGGIKQLRRLSLIQHSSVPVHFFVSPTVQLLLPLRDGDPLPGRYMDTAPFWEATSFKRNSESLPGSVRRGLVCTMRIRRALRGLCLLLFTASYTSDLAFNVSGSGGTGKTLA